jgi:predicted transport protein
MATPTLHAESVAPEGLRDALLSPRHVGNILEADEELREALYELCMSLSDDVQMTDNKTHLHFKWFGGPSRLFAKVKIRPQSGKMNVSIWSSSPILLGYARDVRLLDTPDEDCELEISSVAQVEQAKPHIMESFHIASTPDAGRA